MSEAAAATPKPSAGTPRGVGVVILLYFVTLGIYGLYWYYITHDEMKRETGEGLGGGIALLIAILAGIVMPFITANEVGKMYEKAGHAKPVSAATGLWAFPGIFIIVGPFIWIAKVQGALNRYWQGQA
jgi:Domain of unknown function (DUF4234)